MESSSLRPLHTAEIIDRAVVLWRRHLWTFFQVSLALQLVSFAVTKLWVLLFNRLAPGLRAATQAGPDATLAFLPQLVKPTLILGVLLPLAAWVAWVGRVASVEYGTALALEQPVSLGQAIRRTGERLWTLTGAFCLAGLLTLLLMALCNLPALALGGAALWAFLTKHTLRALALGTAGVVFLMLGTAVGVLWAILRLVLYLPVLSAESGSAWAALGRARDLMRGRIGPGPMGLVKVRASILLTAIYAVLMVIGLVASTPALLVTTIYGGFFHPGGPTPDAVPQLLLIPTELLTVAVQSLFSPLLYLLECVLYVDMRTRREGLDLEARLAQLASGQARP